MFHFLCWLGLRQCELGMSVCVCVCVKEEQVVVYLELSKTTLADTQVGNVSLNPSKWYYGKGLTTDSRF